MQIGSDRLIDVDYYIWCILHSGFYTHLVYDPISYTIELQGSY